MTKTLIRGGAVLMLGARTSNLPAGDVLIEDDRIAEIGVGLRDRSAEVVDATSAIVLPGFIDAHRHVWTSLFRNLGQPSAPASAADMSADDVYAATLIGLLGAAAAGITTVADWFDPPAEGDGLAEAALRAHADSGLRTIFVEASRGERSGSRADAASVRRTLERLAAAAGPRTAVAFGSDVYAPAEPVDAAWPAAREVGCRIHLHATPRGARAGVVADLAHRGLLGADVTIVHWAGLDATDLDAVASSGAMLAISPSGEMAGGFGPPPIQGFVDRDLRPGLGIGHEWLAPGDAFAPMRQTISIQHATVFDRKLAGKGALPKMMTTRDVIRSATSDGARALGMADRTGSLEVGRQADVLVLRTDAPNIFPVNDPIGAVVWGMDTSNVAWSFVGGQALVRDGEAVADLARARELAAAAHARLLPATAGVGA